ncbi:plasmid partitioning protein RepB [Marinovum sp.]|uniref:plasmid partitioning protein RepB n=1 Tax=Marinovum sp. TaxID=2024839 RepID=UPI002B27713B|nr:plasmid partitioning protein RepB [Marinovum sp.]
MARKPRPVFPDPPESGAAATVTPKPMRRAPMFAKGAASLENAAKSAAAEERMYRNLSVDLIDPSPIRDRIDLTEGLEDLKASLASEGQQIPILVRSKPDSDRFEIVTGRRRLQATKDLGRDTIQAFVRRMSDEEAFIAQGVENNARLETSFIERARTIVTALDAGFTQVQVEKFLGVDQSMISRMKSIYSGLGEDLVLAIGPARGTGRRKWERLQKIVSEIGLDKATECALSLAGESSERFDALIKKLEERFGSRPSKRAPSPSPLEPLTATRRGKQLVIRTTTAPEGFLDYLQEQLQHLLEQYEKQRK